MTCGLAGFIGIVLCSSLLALAKLQDTGTNCAPKLVDGSVQAGALLDSDRPDGNLPVPRQNLMRLELVLNQQHSRTEVGRAGLDATMLHRRPKASAQVFAEHTPSKRALFGQTVGMHRPAQRLRTSTPSLHPIPASLVSVF
jgi:hypothetical protein